jgi:hypothetical protein
MPIVVLAWLAGEALIFYRSYKQDKRPPLPGQLLASSGVFAVLGFLADASDDMSFLAGAMAVGFDVAAFMNLAPSITTGNTSAAKAPAKTAPKEATK